VTVRSFLVLCAVTVVVVIAAGVTVVRDHRSDAAAGAAEKLFPALLEEADTLAVLTLRNHEKTLTIQKHEDGWSLGERDDYPVRADAVRDLVLKLGGLERLEAKTNRFEHYPRLGVEDVEIEGARSTEVELLNDDGGVVARLLVGKLAFGVGDRGALYVRNPEENQAWLVRGHLAPIVEAGEWVEPEIIDIPQANVRSVRIVHPDGETVLATKTTVKDEHFTLDGLSGTPSPATAKAIDALAAVLSELRLDNLKKADDVPFPEGATTSVTVLTFDGLTLDVDMTQHEGRDWIRVGAKPDPDADASGNDIAHSAGEIEHRTMGWAYQVSAFAITPWKKRRSDLLSPHSGDEIPGH